MKIFKIKYLIILIIILISTILFQQYNSTNQISDESTIYSPYVGQEERGIKALSQNDIEGLLAGSGTPFGGMAKPAELNGYPGPRRVLDAFESGEFELTNEQLELTEELYESMKLSAIELGEQIIEIEEEIDNKFTSETITEEFLQEKVLESAELYGQLRNVHLKTHLEMVEILTSDQIEQYNELRGYNSDKDPCENVPEGHDPEIWKMHNGCE